MLEGSDIVAAKILGQLGLVPAAELAETLRALDAEPARAPLAERLAAKGRLDAAKLATLRDRMERFRRIRDEASYLHVLEAEQLADKNLMQKILAVIEERDAPVRVGAVLVAGGMLTEDQDHHVLRKRRRRTNKDDQAILERYRAESFAGVAKPLLPTLEPRAMRPSLLLGLKLKDVTTNPELLAWIEKAKTGRELSDAELDAEKDRVAKKRANESASMPVVADVRELKQIGSYRIIETLGSGGAGAVFLGQNETTGEYVAIKVLLSKEASAAQRGRFEREIKVMKRLDHKNVIRAIDSGKTADGITYLVVAALVGKDLRKLLDARKGEGLEPRFAGHVMAQVLEGLQAVHDAKLIHRDLKPHNIYVLAGAAQEVRILDFGLAKFTEGEESAGLFQTMTNEIVGTPAYIAPECVGGEKLDARADIYSLGVVFYELLTGKLPFESDSAQGFLRQHLAMPAPTLAEARPEYPWPKALEALIEKMLAKSPDERPQSCREILATLRGGILAELGKGAPSAPEAAVSASARYGDHGLVDKLDEEEKAG